MPKRSDHPKRAEPVSKAKRKRQVMDRITLEKAPHPTRLWRHCGEVGPKAPNKGRPAAAGGAGRRRAGERAASPRRAEAIVRVKSPATTTVPAVDDAQPGIADAGRGGIVGLVTAVRSVCVASGEVGGCTRRGNRRPSCLPWS